MQRANVTGSSGTLRYGSLSGPPWLLTGPPVKCQGTTYRPHPTQLIAAKEPQTFRRTFGIHSARHSASLSPDKKRRAWVSLGPYGKDNLSSPI